MARHRILRIASRRDRVIRFREIWPTDILGYTEDQVAALDLGCIVSTDEGQVVDLNAYFEMSEAERGHRALDLVS